MGRPAILGRISSVQHWFFSGHRHENDGRARRAILRQADLLIPHSVVAPPEHDGSAATNRRREQGLEIPGVIESIGNAAAGWTDVFDIGRRKDLRFRAGQNLAAQYYL